VFVPDKALQQTLTRLSNKHWQGSPTNTDKALQQTLTRLSNKHWQGSPTDTDKALQQTLTRLSNKHWQGSPTNTSSIPAQIVCAHLQLFAHRIQSFPLWYSEERPIQYRHSAPRSSSVESSAKGTASSVSASDGVSDVAGSLQTLLFRLFEGPRRAFDTSRLVLDLVAYLISFFWFASKMFCKVNSLFSLLFHHEDLVWVQTWHRADIWWSESLSGSERWQIIRTEWWLVPGLHQSRMVNSSSSSSIFVFWG
jgi:hypothetical protein